MGPPEDSQATNEGQSSNFDDEKAKIRLQREEILKSGPSDLPMSSICSSDALEDILAEDPLKKIKFEIPKCGAVDYVNIPKDIDADRLVSW